MVMVDDQLRYLSILSEVLGLRLLVRESSVLAAGVRLRWMSKYFRVQRGVQVQQRQKFASMVYRRERKDG